MSKSEQAEIDRIAKLQNISAQVYMFLKSEGAEQVEKEISMDGKKWTITIRRRMMEIFRSGPSFNSLDALFVGANGPPKGNPVYIPKKHTKQSYRSQQRDAKKRRKQK